VTFNTYRVLLSESIVYWENLPRIYSLSLPLPHRRYPEGKDKVKALYIRIVSPFPEMERFLQDTIKR
jgi:hypothetical protein